MFSVQKEEIKILMNYFIWQTIILFLFYTKILMFFAN